MDLEYNNTTIKVVNGNQQQIIDFYIDKGYYFNENFIDLNDDYIGIDDDGKIVSFVHLYDEILITLELDIWI